MPGYGAGDPRGKMSGFDSECGGPGIDGQGMRGGQGYDRFSTTSQRQTAVEVQQAVVTYLAGYYNNPDLAVIELMDFQHNFYARVAEKSTKINACELLIDPYTGAVQPEYGPNQDVEHQIRPNERPWRDDAERHEWTGWPQCGPPPKCR